MPIRYGAVLKIARCNSPTAAGDLTFAAVFIAPADWPPSVTLLGSLPTACDVGTNSAKRGLLIQNAVVAEGMPFRTQMGFQQEAKRAHAIVDRYASKAATSTMRGVVQAAQRGLRAGDTWLAAPGAASWWRRADLHHKTKRIR